MNSDRRQFLAATASIGLGAATFSSTELIGGERVMNEEQNHAEEEISAAEDLMREHGVLHRVLLVYEEGVRRIRNKDEVSPDVFHATASLVRKFVEDYHEKLEERFIFPEFEKQRQHVDLVTVLRNQHQAGRKATDAILRIAAADEFRHDRARAEIVRLCEAFIRMYRPHEAREDTVLFPALHEILSAEQLSELGEQFEDEEHRLFGDEGFPNIVEQVAGIEKQLGIYDLAQFTAR